MVDAAKNRDAVNIMRRPYLPTSRKYERWEHRVLTTLVYPLFLLVVLGQRMAPAKYTTSYEIPGEPLWAEAWNNASSAIAFAFNACG